LLSYPTSIALSNRTLNYLAGLIRTRRRQRRSRWRRLNPGQQALLALTRLRNGDPFSRLAAGFGVGTATAWRYVREAITLLTDTADDLTAAMTRIRWLAYAILDGILIPIDRVADQKPCYSGNISGTVSTCRLSPIQPEGWSGLHQLCPARLTT
jgi:DDE superfamily endonuclease